MHSAEAGASITRQLLMFGQSDVHPALLNLNDLIADAQDVCVRTLGSGITLKTDLQSGSANIYADLGLMLQVLTNLLANARDSMPNGGTVTVQTAKVELPLEDSSMGLTRTYVTLAVRDTGIGMDPGMADRIFEPFFTTRTPGLGKGLGLALVQGIVKDLNGSIDVQSSPGRGSVFTVFIPRADSAPDPHA